MRFCGYEIVRRSYTRDSVCLAYTIYYEKTIRLGLCTQWALLLHSMYKSKMHMHAPCARFVSLQILCTYRQIACARYNYEIVARKLIINICTMCSPCVSVRSYGCGYNKFCAGARRRYFIATNEWRWRWRWFVNRDLICRGKMEATKNYV